MSYTIVNNHPEHHWPGTTMRRGVVSEKRAMLRLRRAALGPSCAGLLLGLPGTPALACRLGRSSITNRKHEGDGATPAGPLEIVGGYFRPDRIAPISVPKWLRPLNAGLGWCDDPDAHRYNAPVALPYRHAHEKLWRDDRCYDIVLVLDWNLATRARNRGSAIFVHLTRDDLGPTEGCIALSPQAMMRLLDWVAPGTVIHVLA